MGKQKAGSVIIQTVVPEPLAKSVQKRAAQEGISVAAWIRRLIMINTLPVEQRAAHHPERGERSR